MRISLSKVQTERPTDLPPDATMCADRLRSIPNENAVDLGFAEQKVNADVLSRAAVLIAKPGSRRYIFSE